MEGVTDTLFRAVEAAAGRDDGYPEILSGIRERSRRIASGLLDGNAVERYMESLAADGSDLEDVLRGVRLTRRVSDTARDFVVGHGELWSARLLAAHLAGEGEDVACLDAREVLRVEPGRTGPLVDWKTSRDLLRAWRDRNPARCLVITGYIAATGDGVPTTLGRNGSDLSASLFAALLDAEAIQIWTDVSGVASADPRRVPDAVILPRLSYNEAMELAYFGASVLHPHTMAPAIEKGIPIRILDSRGSGSAGTVIEPVLSAPGEATSRNVVKGLSSIDGVALVNVEGTSMLGVPGVAHRLFGALHEAGVSVIMISQASSEHSICFAVPWEQGEGARAAVETAFFSELHHGQIQAVEVTGPGSILAAVGDRMVHTPGVAARFFGALAKAGVNVRAVAQGSSERNVSVVVEQADSTRALRAVHAGFFLSDQTLSVGLIGPGLIGSELLRQLEDQSSLLASRFQIDLRVRGILNSRRMLLEENAVDLGRWKEALESEGRDADLEAFARHVRTDHLPHALLIDCTANEDVAGRYEEWLEAGIHVVTPNKRANSADQTAYDRLRELGRTGRSRYYYEATVGAGLPVIQTLRDLIQTGDRVIRIEGILSGTLSYLFTGLDGGRPFSEAVREARQRGYTEPDPREDLSGMDVARKGVILAREMGRSIELEAVEVESLVPGNLEGIEEPEEFLQKLAAHDEAMEARRAEAERSDRVLRYVAFIEQEGPVTVGLRAFPRDHAFAGVRGTDNIIAFTTRRYHEQPLILRGPGAGPEVTAGGVFADILRLASHLGAPA
jgi:aspartokinase/homoserine dehydrogenase 1